jgi:sec-independent protein translocase protein TatC
MVDATDAISRARQAVSDRAELPGMSLMEHLDELRKRIVHSAIYLGLGFVVAWFFRDRLVDIIQAPLVHDGKSLNMIHPMDGMNMTIHVSLVGGAILASPFILYQVWLFIAPGLYQKERRFVVPFMAATVGLFLTGAYFGYFWVLPAAVHIMLDVFGKKFTAVISIEEYTGFFLSIILGLGISFEMPILIFFLAMFGIVSPKFLWHNFRYAILAIFLVAGVICPMPDPVSMCLYATPMLALYLIGIALAWWVHPDKRRSREAKKVAKA